jgi:lipopolysaccharide transport system ATP-binding protein
MSSDEFAIRVRDVSKHYLLFRRPEDRLKQSIVPRLARLVGRTGRTYYQDFAALKAVTLEVKRGETVGIIGRNGSGKSTLLQIICGTLRPSAGTVEVAGRVAALLELGAGFNPEFTGRENVYMNAAILGMAKSETDARFDAIARFADIGDFIEQPVKTYSSGMYVRLAFAVAVCVEPDVLVVDEALAVGDEAFQRKCFARIEEIQNGGGTILLVTHGAQTIVQLCSRAFLFDRGELLLEGRPKMVVGQYQRLVNAGPGADEALRAELRTSGAFSPTGPHQSANAELGALQLKSTPQAARESYDPGLKAESTMHWESRGARIRDARILTLASEPVNILQTGRRYVYEYFVDFCIDASAIGFGMVIRNPEGLALAGAQTIRSRTLQLRRAPNGSTAHVQFEFSCFMLPGTYFFGCGVRGTTGDEEIVMNRIVDAVMCRVAPEPELIATAFCDIGVTPRIKLL